MRVLSLGLVVMLGACSSIDTSPGSSGVPDMPLGQPGFERGFQSTSGSTTLFRELTPNDPRRFELPPSNTPRRMDTLQPGDPRRFGW